MFLMMIFKSSASSKGKNGLLSGRKARGWPSPQEHLDRAIGLQFDLKSGLYKGFHLYELPSLLPLLPPESLFLSDGGTAAPFVMFPTDPFARLHSVSCSLHWPRLHIVQLLHLTAQMAVWRCWSAVGLLFLLPDQYHQTKLFQN